jgi:phosphoglycolate phosphatase-like HAD superfamily hydrolase
MNLERYLQKLQDDVGGAAGVSTGTSAAAGISARYDSFPGSEDIPHKRKKKQVLRVAYPNEAVVKSTQVMRAMIDLDRTIHKYSKSWQDGSVYDDPIPGAKEVIDWLKSKGYEIVIFTTRASAENAKEHGQDLNDQIQGVENWLSNNNIYYDRVTAEKLNADFYIDDKAIHIKDGNWLEVLKEIKSRISH